MSAVTDMLAAIDTQVAAIIANPNDIVSYHIGDKQVSKAEKIQWLLEARTTYQELAEKEPYEDIKAVALFVSELGSDESEYIGDEEA